MERVTYYVLPAMTALSCMVPGLFRNPFKFFEKCSLGRSTRRCLPTRPLGEVIRGIICVACLKGFALQ